MIGAPPFGEGLQQWLKRSPGFNLDKINDALVGRWRRSRQLAIYVGAICRTSLSYISQWIWSC